MVIATLILGDLRVYFGLLAAPGSGNGSGNVTGRSASSAGGGANNGNNNISVMSNVNGGDIANGTGDVKTDNNNSHTRNVSAGNGNVIGSGNANYNTSASVGTGSTGTGNNNSSVSGNGNVNANNINTAKVEVAAATQAVVYSGADQKAAVGFPTSNASLCSSNTIAYWNNMDTLTPIHTRCCPVASAVFSKGGQTWCTDLVDGSECVHNEQCKNGNCRDFGTINGKCGASVGSSQVAADKAAAATAITGKYIKVYRDDNVVTRTVLGGIDVFDQNGQLITGSTKTYGPPLPSTESPTSTELILNQDTLISRIVVRNRTNGFLDRINGCRLVVTNATGVVVFRSNKLGGSNEIYTFNAPFVTDDSTKASASNISGFVTDNPGMCLSKAIGSWNNMEVTQCCRSASAVLLKYGKSWCKDLEAGDACYIAEQCKSGNCTGTDLYTTLNGKCGAPKPAITMPSTMKKK